MNNIDYNAIQNKSRYTLSELIEWQPVPFKCFDPDFIQKQAESEIKPKLDYSFILRCLDNDMRRIYLRVPVSFAKYGEISRGESRTDYRYEPRPCIEVKLNESDIEGDAQKFIAKTLDGQKMIGHCQPTIFVICDGISQGDELRELNKSSDNPKSANEIETIIANFCLDRRPVSFYVDITTILPGESFAGYLDRIVNIIKKRGGTKFKIKWQRSIKETDFFEIG